MIDFLQVQNSVRELKNQLAAQQIDEKTLEERLLEMIEIAEDGYYWMFGHQSERWFRYDGQKWLPDDPSKILVVRSQKTGSPAADSTVEQNNALGDLSINWIWFIASIIIIFGIGWIIYLSALD
jgi:hypothetical protein